MTSTSEGPSHDGQFNAVREIVRITLAVVLFWGLLAGPAWLLAAERGLIGLSVSALLCWLPACLVQPLRGGLNLPADLFAVLSGAVRLGFVLTAALLAKFRFPEFGINEFFAWLVLMYLLTLGVETWLLARRKTDSTRQTDSRD